MATVRRSLFGSQDCTVTIVCDDVAMTASGLECINGSDRTITIWAILNNDNRIERVVAPFTTQGFTFPTPLAYTLPEVVGKPGVFGFKITQVKQFGFSF